MGSIVLPVLFGIALQAADTPESAIDGWQKAIRDKKWDLAYDWQSPAERARLEKGFKEGKFPHLEEAAQLLEMSKEDLLKLTFREFHIRFSKRMDALEPEHFGSLGKAKLTKKEKEGEDWVFESIEKSMRGNVPVTSRLTVAATREGGKWYVNAWKGAERKSNETNASGTLKSLAMAQEDFKSEDRDGDGKKNYWVADVRGLFTLKGKDGKAIGLIEKETASADAVPSKLSPESPELKMTSKAGYYYVALKNGQKKGKPTPFDEGKGRCELRFGIAAYPEKYPATGKLTFIMCEDGIVWGKDTGGKAPDVFPEAPKKDGWEPVEGLR